MPKEPVWLDPLNKAMGLVPESLQRGAQAVGQGIESLSPEMAPPADPNYPNIWEEQVAGRVPQGFRDFADFMGGYAGISGFDPASAGGKAVSILSKPSDLALVARTQVDDVTKAYGRTLRKDTPSGAMTQQKLDEIMADPSVGYQLKETGNAGQFSNKAVLESRRRLGPSAKNALQDVPEDVKELIEVMPTAVPRTRNHEFGHAIWKRQGEAQKQAWRSAVDSGQIPEHPMLQHKGYDRIRPGTARDASQKARRDLGKYDIADRVEESYYDEMFQHWFADRIEGEVKLPKGGYRPVEAQDLPAMNYLDEFVGGTGGPLPPAPSPLAGANIASDPLLNVIMPK